MKFINLLKKELSELCNAQMFLGLLVAVIIFGLMGGIMKDSIDEVVEEAKNSKITISDYDDTEYTQEMLKALEAAGSEVKIIDASGDDYAAILNDNKIKNLVIIPEGFTKALEERKTPELICVSKMESVSTISGASNPNSAAVSIIGDYIAVGVASDGGLSPDDIAITENPVSTLEKTVVGDKSADIDQGSVLGKISMQNMILPIVIFVLIMMCTQTLITAISNEKLDKTLETLLSAPVSRLSVIGAKMLAAAIVALINAAVYMFSFSYFVSDATSTISEETAAALVDGYVSVEKAIVQLGLSLTAMDYVLIGLQLFFTILICLSISLILGALVNDTKSSQTVIMPIMMMAMVPYFVSMLTDINTLPTALKYLLYAIPFTHTFYAIPNLMFDHMGVFFGGLAYQIVLFAVFIFFALKLFTSDKIFTISLNFGQKSKYRKKSKKTANDDE